MTKTVQVLAAPVVGANLIGLGMGRGNTVHTAECNWMRSKMEVN